MDLAAGLQQAFIQGNLEYAPTTAEQIIDRLNKGQMIFDGHSFILAFDDIMNNLTKLTPQGLNRLFFCACCYTTRFKDFERLLIAGVDLLGSAYGESLLSVVGKRCKDSGFIKTSIKYIKDDVNSKIRGEPIIILQLMYLNFEMAEQLALAGARIDRYLKGECTCGRSNCGMKKAIDYGNKLCYFPILMLLTTRKSKVYPKRPLLPKELIMDKLYKMLISG